MTKSIGIVRKSRFCPVHDQRQSGVALITALMVVALATVAAVSITSRQELDIRRTSNMLHADQAFAYALGVETWARVILEKDAKDSDIDHLGENWATILPPIAVDGGEIGGVIEDLQGRFNLNSLIIDGKGTSTAGNKGGQTGQTAKTGKTGKVGLTGKGGQTAQTGNNNASQKGQENEIGVKQFERLLTVLGLAPELAQGLLDWMDSDIDSRFPDGAEDDEYLSGKIPYRTANGPLVSTSELRLIKGFDAASVAKLLPYVTILGGGTQINVNTASIPVLQSLAPDISQSDAESLVETRGENGFETMDVFLQHPALAGRELKNTGMGLTSDYFLLRGQVRVGDIRTQMYSIIHRSQEGSEVLIHTRGSE